MTKDSKFEDYLRERYAKDKQEGYPVCNNFSDWLDSLYPQHWLDYADKFANKKVTLEKK